MYQFSYETNLIIQGLVAVIIIGIAYIVIGSKIHGGPMAIPIRFLGIGLMLFSLAAIERSLVNFAIINSTVTTSMTQDIMSLLGLLFLGYGFSKLVSIAKS